MCRILIAGDYCPHNRINDLIEKGEYNTIFDEVRLITGGVDYSIVNFECPIVERSAIPISKCGPNLKCSSDAVKAISYAGFNCVTLANNHFYDYGDIGVEDSLTTLNTEGLDYVGGGKNIEEARNILYKEIDKYVLAIINCCEHEFSIATSNSGGANPLDPIEQYYAIKEAKSKADFVIVIVHGGHEHYQLPSPRMKKNYHFFVDAGADVVLNHHQHCYSGFEIYNARPIFYGLGNFCFDWHGKRSCIWNEGYMVDLSLTSSKIDFKLIPYIQGDVKPTINMLKAELLDIFNAKIAELNNIINFDDSLIEEYKSYLQGECGQYILSLEPYENGYFKAARLRHLIPSFLNKKHLLRIENYINCEAHLDMLRYAIGEEVKRKC